MRRYCGRDFTDQEIEQIKELITEGPNRSRAELSRLACQALAWYKADGGLKEMSCRVAMLRMAEDDLMTLPPPRCKPPQQKILFTAETEPQPGITQPVHTSSTVLSSGASSPFEIVE